MTSTSLLWNDWLTRSRCIRYRHCSHVEYVEQADLRTDVVDELRSVIESHHLHSPNWTRLLSCIGFPSLAETLKHKSTGLPSRMTRSNDDNTDEEQELTTQRGNFCEVLAAEYAITQMGFDVPIRRLRYNPNPDQSMKGDDVLGFRFPPTHGSTAVLVGESKYRGRSYPSVVRAAVEEAYRNLCLSQRSYPTSMDFVAIMLELERDQERSQWVRQMRAQLQSGKIPVERHYLIFLGTLGTPGDPFAWLDEQASVVSNVTCVNIVFAPDIQSWLHKLFDRDA